MLAPPNAERLPTLDILRGFALMGILIMLMPGFSYSGFTEADGSFHWLGRVDQLAEQVRDALSSDKFNSMFSLLFGIGFTIQFTRMHLQEPLHATGLYERRLLLLLVIGLLHVTLLWTGDVLHVYAVLGLLLVIGLRRMSNHALPVLMAACLVYPLLTGALRFAIFTPAVVATRVQQALALGLVCGAAFSTIFALHRVPGPSPIKMLGTLCYPISRPAMMIVYVLLIVCLAQLPPWQRGHSPIAANRRMPLTNYLMQTLMCTTLFYNWGSVLSLTIFFGLQVPFCLRWARHHEPGPVETLWARLTCGSSGLKPRPAARPQ